MCFERIHTHRACAWCGWLANFMGPRASTRVATCCQLHRACYRVCCHGLLVVETVFWPAGHRTHLVQGAINATTTLVMGMVIVLRYVSIFLFDC